MAVENWQLETRNAIWEALHADAEWLGAFAGGTEYRFSATELLSRYEVEDRRCPIIAIGPASADLMPISRATKGAESDSYTIQVEMAHRTVDEAEALVNAFHAAMRAQWATLGAVRSNRLYQIDASVNYEQTPNKDSARPLWLAVLKLVCRYRAA